MAKNIIKEIIIFLLLTLAIILILGVLLYKYVPSNKIIPETISYTTSENVKLKYKQMKVLILLRLLLHIRLIQQI